MNGRHSDRPVARILAAAALAALSLLPLPSGAAGPGPAALVGKPAPELSARLPDGTVISLSGLRGKVPVVVTFWSIYCKTCTEELVALQRLYEKHGRAKLMVIAVNEDSDVGLARVNAFLSRFPSSEGGAKLTFPIVFDEGGTVFRTYKATQLPTLVYVDRQGVVRGVVEGYEKGTELAVSQAIGNLLAAVSPEALEAAAAESTYDLDVVVPVCGVYRDGKWYRPLDLDESGRPEALARARARGEEHLQREAVRLALADLGVALQGAPRPPGCNSPYGLEIRTPPARKEPLDLLIDKLNLPRIIEVTAQDTIEREREMYLYRRFRIHLPPLQEHLTAEGYTKETSTIRLRFVRSTYTEEQLFLDAIRSGYPYLADLRPVGRPRGGTELLLVSHAAPEKAVEKLQALSIGARNIAVDLLPGNIAEVTIWR